MRVAVDKFKNTYRLKTAAELKSKRSRAASPLCLEEGSEQLNTSMGSVKRQSIPFKVQKVRNGIDQSMELEYQKPRRTTVNKNMANNSEVRKEFWGQTIGND
jgi:hypothetical protein